MAVSFNDVCIIDRKSDIASRRDIGNFKTRLARDIFLNIPIVSANMPDITDSRMAIALARLGGLGFIHQFLPIEKRVEEVKRVKRADSSIIEKPITIRFSERLSDARALMDAYQISGLLVVDEEGKLVGILTSRDMRLQEDLSLYVKEAMTPMPLVVGSPDTTKESARVLLRQYKVEKLPLVDKAGKVAGLITAKDIIKAAQYRSAVRDKKGRLLVGATIGAHRNNILSDVDQLVKAGMDVLLIDTARAFADPVEALLKEIRAAFNELPIVVGNIDRPEAALMLIEAGADAVKVGIGPGSACKTREETGVGTPQLTAIAECAAIADEHHIPVVADGGIRVGADVAKALVAGASAVMLGSLLGGSEEAPGEAFYEEGKKWKIYRGSASLEAQLSRMDGGGLDHVRPTEGIQRRVAYRGEVSSIIEDLVGHLRSSMSYVGAHTLDEFKALGTFRRQTEAGYLEGKPHRNEE
ncbi:MAG: hypothetical protein A2939_00130 [Parcubacteria group bacterium RIFCSPLOWO2_01_FULL_48_18]|nr:MAG: hypothetical protein A3J67_05915 [Parcubacteria group bacterium RIFCSPHIGHO2_02_FULL_48_10b]OHB22198.1 MAG: hypothetical protein A2939_00130 [Parcubacteria group bacterium RIFCSPLOWO2_01_FULL_48_18]